MSLARNILPASILATILAVSMWSAPVNAETNCFGDWSDAAPVVNREGLKSTRDVQEMARERVGGDVVRITLCRADEGFVYKLVVRGWDGRISNLTVAAAAGAD